MPRARSSEARRAAATARPGPTRDERLRLARRVDWRFLLPSPDLGRVAVMGTIDDDLRAALAALGPVTQIGDDRSTHAGITYDTVVASGHIERSRLAVAASAVAGSGRLVLEVGGPLAGPLVDGRSSGIGAAVRLGRSLEAGGFGSVRTWWTWPSHARAVSWARIDDPIAVRAMVERRLGRRIGRLAGDLAGRLVRRPAGERLLGLGAPALTLIATRAGPADGIIEHRLAPPAGAEPGEPTTGLLVLSPRYRASAHVVGLGLDEAVGTIARVVKVARLADDSTLAHEAAILGALGPTLGATGRCPLLIDAPGLPTEIGGVRWPVLVETGIDGAPLDGAAVRRDRGEAVRGVASFLGALPVRRATDRATPIATRLSEALAQIRAIGRVDGGADLGVLAERASPVLATLADAPLPRVFEHGDPAHPNLLVLPDGSVGAVDWERGESDGLPLHDLTIALAYIAAADRGAKDAGSQAMAFRAALAGPDPWAATVLDREAVRVGVDTALRPALVVASCARSVAWLAGHLEATRVAPEAGGADGRD
ncbi:MAG TPA: aminoglycoside phosphotransferase family protein, partial [Candidatus Limnocylindrales bacterium]